MDSTDVYGDLKDIPLDEKVSKLEEKNTKLLDHIKQLETDISKLCNELTQMKDREGTLKRNISELYNTAKMENERNQRRITELQDKVDNFRFGRRPFNNDHKNSREREFESKKSPERNYRNRNYKTSRSLDRHNDRFRSDRERSNSIDRRRSRDRDYYHHKPGRRPDRSHRHTERTDRHEKVDRSLKQMGGDDLKIEVKNERVRPVADVKEENCSLKFDSETKVKMKADENCQNDVKCERDMHVEEVTVNANPNKRRRCVIKIVN